MQDYVRVRVRVSPNPNPNPDPNPNPKPNPKQDYVKTVPRAHKVAWTRYPIEFGYFPCKNDIVSGAALSAKVRARA